MKIIHVRYFILVASIILLVLNVYDGYTDNTINYLNITSNLLLAFVMIVKIRDDKKLKSNN